MKAAYPIIITPPEKEGDYYLVYIPDFDTNTEGKSIEDAMYMAKDAIGLLGIVLEDQKKPIPTAATFKPSAKENEFVALVDVDFSAYRNQQENRTVRKNCTIPAWLDKKATAQGVNFSAVLQNALMKIVDQ